jgi:hypothetical protein
MPLIRLIGLILFITSIFLALAAAATQTTHIRVKKPSARAQRANLVEEEPPVIEPEFTPVLPPTDDAALHQAVEPTIEFRTVPIVIPLAISSSLGLALWFFPAVLESTGSSKPRRRRVKRRFRKK